MRFLLCGINAKYIHSNLAIFSLKAYADRKKIPGAEIILKEYTVSPDVKIWAGGPDVSYAANKFLMENPAVDLIMQGEGEEVFSELIRLTVEEKCRIKDIY